MDFILGVCLQTPGVQILESVRRFGECKKMVGVDLSMWGSDPLPDVPGRLHTTFLLWANPSGTMSRRSIRSDHEVTVNTERGRVDDQVKTFA